MTAEILNDVIMKMRLAEAYVEMHKGSINFELGTLAAGVNERFRNMIKVYREYSNLTALRDKLADSQKYLFAYQTIHGYYNEILQERRTFFHILEAYNKKKEIAEKKRKEDEEIRRKEERRKKRPRNGITKDTRRILRALEVESTTLMKLAAESVTKPMAREKDKQNTEKKNDREKGKEKEEKSSKKTGSVQRSDDSEYKRQLRMEMYEKRRNNFVPELEGIKVDLNDYETIEPDKRI